MFKNRVRLPLYLKTAQFPTEANRFRLSNGTAKTLSVTIRKQYSLQTDYMAEVMHQRLVIALNHDNVNIEGKKYVGGVAVDGDYEITWPDFLDYPLGQGATKIQVTPFDFTNDNCQTCEQATQLHLVDDDAGEINEGETGEVNVFLNDTICCFPIVAEIVSFNTTYLDDAVIDATTGIVTLTAKDPSPSVGSIVMATYRVTCPDGTYDEADIYASINGSEPACEQPSNFSEPNFAGYPYDVVVGWVNPTVPPSGGYEWILYEASNPGVPLSSGTTLVNSATVTAPTPGTEYLFSVRSVCDGGIFSAYSSINFTTPGSGSDNCGEFTITIYDGTINPDGYNYSYMDCSGNIVNETGINLSTILRCMLTDPVTLQPVYFEGAFGVFTVSYSGIC